MAELEVWTVTVDDGTGITTEVFLYETSGINWLFEEYDEEDEYDRDMQTLIDSRGLVVHITSHILEVEVGQLRTPERQLVLAELARKAVSGTDEDRRRYLWALNREEQPGDL